MAIICSVILRRIDFSRGLAMTEARKMFRTSCWVIVLPPTRYDRSPLRFVISAPTIRIGSTPGCS